MKRHGPFIGRWYSTKNPWQQALSKKKGIITMRTEPKIQDIPEEIAENQIEGYKLAVHLHQERLETFDECPRPIEFSKTRAMYKVIKKSRNKIHLVQTYNPSLTITCKTHNWSSCTTSLKDTTCRICIFRFLKENVSFDMLQTTLIKWGIEKGGKE